MPNAAPSHATSSNQRLGDPDKDNSAAEYSSGIDSENDGGPNECGSSRALKRKRPLTVSYVPGWTMPHTRARAGYAKISRLI